MSAAPDHAARIAAFLSKWQESGAAERANAQLFVTGLSAVLEVEPPQPSTPNESLNACCFEQAIPSATGTTTFMDRYKRGRFVLETLAALGRARKNNEPWSGA